MRYTLFLMLFITLKSITPQSSEICYDCHADPQLTTSRNGRTVSLFIKESRYKFGAHRNIACEDCHENFNPDDLPHREGENIYKVNCAKCHGRLTTNFRNSLHGQALRRGAYLAPDCGTCHGDDTHYLISSRNQNSKTYVMNVPALCGECHKEGTEVSALENVDESHVLEDYSQSIHGAGLFQQGLIVTAVCNSCHTSHNILPHENPRSSIHRNNVPKTCMQCHAQIEKVHKKIIAGKLWEKEPHNVPVCVDCHQPHKIRKVFYDERFNNEFCMECHQDKNLTMTRSDTTVSLYVDDDHLYGSIHGSLQCVQCHTNVSQSKDPVCKESGRVDCSNCHNEEGMNYEVSTHGTLFMRGDKRVPYCTDCHGDHGTLAKTDENSPIFTKNQPDLCAKCHNKYNSFDMFGNDIVEAYRDSKHGEGLLESGLIVSATCADCHTPHMVLPVDDPRSSTHPDNVAQTCSGCHLGIYDVFIESTHSTKFNDTDEKLPVCYDCHSAHEIVGTEDTYFRSTIIGQCGGCHEEVTESYFDTHHGKVSQLGSITAARCSDCHGAHNILPSGNPRSTLHRDNVVETCRTCHPNSNKMFAGYLTHATHHDPDKYPILFYTFWFMTGLLVFTFTFFGAHTLMWLPRSFKEKKRHEEHMKHLAERDGGAANVKHFQRFDKYSRILHIMVITSFLALAITGMTIKFANVPVFQVIADIFGGVEVTKFIHRLAAVVTFAYFVLHISYLLKKKSKRKQSWKEFLISKNTLVPNKKDIQDFIGTMKWFVGKGPRPDYGKWTYWEKFDYFAVFWGVAIIGSTGLLLWFSEFFTSLGIPGWLINVATIIHSDEALLATGFIFTIHFFNTHFRPDKFPMDNVIFTGSIPVEELEYDRPEQYKELIERNELEEHIVEPPQEGLKKSAKIFGFIALSLGILFILLIIYSMIFLYQ